MVDFLVNILVIFLLLLLLFLLFFFLIFLFFLLILILYFNGIFFIDSRAYLGLILFQIFYYFFIDMLIAIMGETSAIIFFLTIIFMIIRILIAFLMLPIILDYWDLFVGQCWYITWLSTMRGTNLSLLY